jgi:ribulose-phosphate 3-epimerase
MQIIPTINCENLSCVEQKVRLLKGFLPSGEMIHFDIADGTFTKNITWNNADELKSIMDFYNSGFKTGVHLMVDNPEAIAEKWLQAGVKEVTAHIERITDRNFFKRVCVHYGAEPGIAISPETSIQTALGYVDDFKKILILAVTPGLSGQVLQPDVLEKVKDIKRLAPDVFVAVDGGVNLENIKLIRESGADAALSGSYIFNAGDPAKAYSDLTNA